jgi:hypothetical protein
LSIASSSAPKILAITLDDCKEQLAHALRILTRPHGNDDMPERIKDPELCGHR